MKRTVSAFIAIVLASAACVVSPSTAPPFQTPAAPLATLGVEVVDQAGVPKPGAAAKVHTQTETTSTNNAGYASWVLPTSKDGYGLSVSADGCQDAFKSVLPFLANEQVRIELVCQLPTPPTPPFVVTPRPLVGPLRVQDKLFRDDSGYRRVFFASWFTALRTLRENPVEFDRQLDALAAAGYQGARVFLAVGGWSDYWDGYEVAPVTFQKWFYTGNFMRTDRLGSTMAAWPDYDDVYRRLLRKFKERGLRLHVTTGDMQIITGADLAKELELHRRFARIAAEEGGTSVIALAEVTNEFPFNRYGSDSQESIAQMGRVIDTWRQAIPGVLTAQGAIPQDEEPASFTKASTFGQVVMTHTTRRPVGVSLKRTLAIIYFEGDWRAFPKPFWQGEPAGPGDDSFDRVDDRPALTSLYALHALSGQASNQFAGPSVRGCVRSQGSRCVETGPLEAAWGFKELPAILANLPEDVATWSRSTAGGGAILYWSKGQQFATATFEEWDPTPPRPIAEWTLYAGDQVTRGTGAPPAKATGLLIGTFR